MDKKMTTFWMFYKVTSAWEKKKKILFSKEFTSDISEFQIVFYVWLRIEVPNSLYDVGLYWHF